MKISRLCIPALKCGTLELSNSVNCSGGFRFWLFKRFVINKGRPNTLDLDRARESVRSFLNKIKGGKDEQEERKVNT